MTVNSKVSTVDSFQLNDQLATTGYTNQWVLEMLNEHNPKFALSAGNSNVKSMEARDISEAKGFMSHVFRVVVTFENDKEYSFVMKVPTFDCLDELFKSMDMSEEARAKMVNDLKDVHNKECQAYESIKGVKNFPIPNVYYTENVGGKNPGVIVMEDLSGKATTIGFCRSPTKRHCLEVAKHFGHFQAQMAKDPSNWKGNFTECFHTNSTTNVEFTKFLNKVVELKLEFEEDVKRMLTVDRAKFNKYALQLLPQKYNATTLCQGDAHCNNLMMEMAEDGSVLDKIAAVIDWQAVFEGNPYHDLSRFITMCSDAEIRRAIEEQAVNLHYDTFCETSKELGLDVKFSREEAHIMYDYASIQQTYDLFAMISFTQSNLEKVSENVLEAHIEKSVLRGKLGLKDAFKKMEKHGVFENFPAKTNEA